MDKGDSSVSIGNLSGHVLQGNKAVALGSEAGTMSQGINAVAIGSLSGSQNQGINAVAIGSQAGRISQGINAVAIGSLSGSQNQREGAVAIGSQAGQTDQRFSVAIGAKAGQTNQSLFSIVLNATSSELNTTQSSAFYVKPIRVDASQTIPLCYNPSTGEVVQSSSKTRNTAPFVFQLGSDNKTFTFPSTSDWIANIILIGKGGNMSYIQPDKGKVGTSTTVTGQGVRLAGVGEQNNAGYGTAYYDKTTSTDIIGVRRTQCGGGGSGNVVYYSDVFIPRGSVLQTKYTGFVDTRNDPQGLFGNITGFTTFAINGITGPYHAPNGGLGHNSTASSTSIGQPGGITVVEPGGVQPSPTQYFGFPEYRGEYFEDPTKSDYPSVRIRRSYNTSFVVPSDRIKIVPNNLSNYARTSKFLPGIMGTISCEGGKISSYPLIDQPGGNAYVYIQSPYVSNTFEFGKGATRNEYSDDIREGFPGGVIVLYKQYSSIA